MKGELVLLPNLLDSEGDHKEFLPQSVNAAIAGIDGLIAENERAGRRYLQRFSFDRDRTFRDLPIVLFNKHYQEVEEVLAPLRKGEKWGLVSDAGLPVIADPGYQLVKRCHDYGIKVQALVGPSSLLMALMLSGLPAQKFAFHGYPPKDLGPFVEGLEKGVTHMVIEAPFRNDGFLKKLLEQLSPKDLVSIAADLTLSTEWVETCRAEVWKKRDLPVLHKRPTIFLMHLA